MITVNIHDAKTRLSALIKMVEEGKSPVIICRNGKPVAELQKPKEIPTDRLKPHPVLSKVILNYDPTEPLQPDEIPEEYR
jgi:prevent-host-death family protein